jgi:pimeloyl-ACP methyl ester carboxylesterase
MPDEGESIQQLFENVEVFAGSLVPAALRQVPFTNPDGSQGVDLYLDREAFPGAFCADVGPETAKVMAATQRPWGGAGYATPSGPPAWRSIPSWYLVGTEDRAIPPAGQRFMAERGNARIEEVAASHASMVSPAGGRDVADPERRGGDQPRRGGERVTAVPRPPAPGSTGAPVRRIRAPRPSDIARRGARGRRRQRSAGPAPARLSRRIYCLRQRGDKGGHFAAWEQPQLFSEEVRAAFRSLR